MTNFTRHNVQRIILTVFLVGISTNMLFAQFPTGNSNTTMVGSWKVVNIDNFDIQLQVNNQQQFRMAVNGKESQGQMKVNGDQVTLNFTDGTKQEFSMSRNNGQLVFAAVDGNQKFVMDRVESVASASRNNTGFPEGDSEETDVEEETANDTSPNQNLVGAWYAKLEDNQVEIYVKSEFRQDGTYTTSLLMIAGSEKEKQTDEGRWKVQDGKLISVSNGETAQEVAPIQFVENDLVIDMTQEFGTRMVMSRSPDHVKPSRFDMQKLIEYAQDQARR